MKMASYSAHGEEDLQNKPSVHVRMRSNEINAYNILLQGVQPEQKAPKPPREIYRKGFKGGGRIVKESEKQKMTAFPMKVQNINTMVQIKRKRPKMTFNN
jgi:hypothetical protein